MKIPLPVTIKKSLIVTPLLTSNPLFGEIIAVDEPDLILSISPIESADILNNPLPSPLNTDADMDDETFNEPVICVLAFICNGDVLLTPITLV